MIMSATQLYNWENVRLNICRFLSRVWFSVARDRNEIKRLQPSGPQRVRPSTRAWRSKSKRWVRWTSSYSLVRSRSTTLHRFIFLHIDGEQDQPDSVQSPIES